MSTHQCCDNPVLSFPLLSRIPFSRHTYLLYIQKPAHHHHSGTYRPSTVIFVPNLFSNLTDIDPNINETLKSTLDEAGPLHFDSNLPHDPNSPSLVVPKVYGENHICQHAVFHPFHPFQVHAQNRQLYPSPNKPFHHSHLLYFLSHNPKQFLILFTPSAVLKCSDYHKPQC